MPKPPPTKSAKMGAPGSKALGKQVASSSKAGSSGSKGGAPAGAADAGLFDGGDLDDFLIEESCAKPLSNSRAVA